MQEAKEVRLRGYKIAWLFCLALQTSPDRVSYLPVGIGIKRLYRAVLLDFLNGHELNGLNYDSETAKHLTLGERVNKHSSSTVELFLLEGHTGSFALHLFDINHLKR